MSGRVSAPACKKRKSPDGTAVPAPAAAAAPPTEWTLLGQLINAPALAQQVGDLTQKLARECARAAALRKKNKALEDMIGVLADGKVRDQTELAEAQAERDEEARRADKYKRRADKKESEAEARLAEAHALNDEAHKANECVAELNRVVSDQTQTIKTLKEKQEQQALALQDGTRCIQQGEKAIAALQAENEALRQSYNDGLASVQAAHEKKLAVKTKKLKKMDAKLQEALEALKQLRKANSQALAAATVQSYGMTPPELKDALQAMKMQNKAREAKQKALKADAAAAAAAARVGGAAAGQGSSSSLSLALLDDPSLDGLLANSSFYAGTSSSSSSSSSSSRATPPAVRRDVSL